MTKTRTGSYYRLSDNARNVIRMIADERKISQAHAIEWLTDEYIRSKAEKESETMKLLLELKEDVRRVRAASNVIDRNTQMQIEFWNHYFIVNKFKMLGSTEKYKAEELTEAEELVKKRIAHLRQKKLDWENTRQKKSST